MNNNGLNENTVFNEMEILEIFIDFRLKTKSLELIF